MLQSVQIFDSSYSTDTLTKIAKEGNVIADRENESQRSFLNKLSFSVVKVPMPCKQIKRSGDAFVFVYDTDFNDVHDWDRFARKFRRTLSDTLDVSESEIKLLGTVPGTISAIVAATVAIIAALQKSGIDPTAKTIMTTTIAGAGMGAVIGTALGPVGTAVGGAIGGAVGWATGYFATKPK